MARVRCFLLEDTGREWASADGRLTAPIYRRPDTGEEMTLRDAPPGAMFRASWFHGITSQDDAAPLGVKLPNGDAWYIDGQAGNCAMRDDHSQRRHHCWIRHGAPPDVTVDKAGVTCAAGAGSILSGNYHGFLRAGWLED